MISIEEVVKAANEYAAEYRKQRFQATAQSSNPVDVVCGFQAGVKWAMKKKENEHDE